MKLQTNNTEENPIATELNALRLLLHVHICLSNKSLRISVQCEVSHSDPNLRKKKDNYYYFLINFQKLFWLMRNL